MRLSFFEEFPARTNLEKLKSLTWPTKLYLAAPSLRRFQEIKRRIKNKYIKQFIYWPVLRKEEGYWISPFSRHRALQRIFSELKGKRVPVMLDLELPTTQNPLLYLTQSLWFWSNKRRIRHFVESYKGTLYLCEYFPEGKKYDSLLRLLGLDYAAPKAKIIKMIYTSLRPFPEHFIREELRRGKQQHGKKFIVAYGVLLPGVQGDEPVLRPAQLRRDLSLAEEAGISEVILYRLGGLNRKYLGILQYFYSG